MTDRTLIIAEAGVNHNGSLKRAKEMVAVAAQAGADVVKFQTFLPELLTTKIAPLAEYQKKNISEDSQYEMLQKLRLNEEMHHSLLEYCVQQHIEFLSTPFDIPSCNFLNQLGIKRHKVASGEITNLPLLRVIARSGLPVILSTGMSTLDEVEAALKVLEQEGLKLSQITLLQCTTEYPAPDEESNLRAMQTMRTEFGVDVGFSDHTLGTEIAFAAVALGATVIEKHFTLDKSLNGPDQAASLEPNDLAQMIKGIRRIEAAMGTGLKQPSSSEEKNIAVARKSLVALTPIKAGEEFTPGNLTSKRPGTGISPMRWDDVIGRKAQRNFAPDEPIDCEI
jgi:N-acetylneuraminate synthase